MVPWDLMVAWASCCVDAFHHRALGYLVNTGRSIKRWSETTHRETLLQTVFGPLATLECGQMLVNIAAGTTIPSTRAKAFMSGLKGPVCRLWSICSIYLNRLGRNGRQHSKVCIH